MLRPGAGAFENGPSTLSSGATIWLARGITPAWSSFSPILAQLRPSNPISKLLSGGPTAWEARLENLILTGTSPGPLVERQFRILGMRQLVEGAGRGADEDVELRVGGAEHAAAIELEARPSVPEVVVVERRRVERRRVARLDPPQFDLRARGIGDRERLGDRLGVGITVRPALRRVAEVRHQRSRDGSRDERRRGPRVRDVEEIAEDHPHRGHHVVGVAHHVVGSPGSRLLRLWNGKSPGTTS